MSVRSLGLFLCAAASASAIAYTSGPATAAVTAYRVSARVSHPVFSAGAVAQITGTVTPSAAGHPVYLQRFYSNSWHRIGTQTLNRRSVFNFSYRVTTPGAWSVRIFKPAGRIGAGSSPSLRFTVYGWHYLSDLPPAQDRFWNGSGPLSINGPLYPHSVSSINPLFVGETAYAEYGLARRCTRFAATIGMSDASASGSTVTIEVLVDGVEMRSDQYALGRSSVVTLNVSGALRLRLQVLGDSDGTNGGGAQGAFGNARVFCAW
jgi:hypothetical protein